VSTSVANPENQATELEAIYLLFTGLLSNIDAQAGLGGSLLYAGEPDESAVRLLRAANIAGVASLAASADGRTLRQAMREGAIDFVVTSLDEALRILKNEIRKCEPVAVGVSVSPALLEQEMQERGVLPNLLARHLSPTSAISTFLTQGARSVAPVKLPAGIRFLVLPIPAAWIERAAAFDALLLDCLPESDALNRRWLHLSRRYLGAASRRIRSLACDEETAALLMQKLAQPPPT